MNKRRLFMGSLLMVLVFSGCTHKQEKETTIIDKPTLDLSGKTLTPEIMWGMGKIGEYAVSPDKTQIIYTLTYYSIEANKGNSEIYVMQMDGSNIKRLTTTSANEFNIQWNPSGDKIGFLKNTDSGVQFFEMDKDGRNVTQISNFSASVEGFRYAPDGKKIYYIQTVEKNKEFKNLYAGLDKTSGRINEDLLYRHWDEWVDRYPHIFIADFNGTALTNAFDILEGEPYESPMRPFGGAEQITWSPDSKTIAYTCRKKKGKEYALSTNSDIYLFSLENKTTQNISEGMMGYDMNPVFSPDGKYIAWESMEDDGYEADKIRLFTYDLASKQAAYLTDEFDQNVSSLQWSDDSQNIYFISPWHGVEDIYKIDVQSKFITRLTNGVHDYMQIQLANNHLVASQMSMSMPTELFSIDLEKLTETQISFVNKDVLEKLNFGKVEERWITTSDNKPLMTWIVYPPNFDSTKTYPALLYCQGGPQSMVSQFWSTRWNLQLMAANGYIVVAPNRRGLPGFGQEWTEAISKNYTGQNLQDYLNAIDAAAKEKYVDANRLGAVGASYGGFSVYWLAGNHHKRFKAFIAHNGMFNLEQQYLETEELWFVNWDIGGPYWDKSNASAQRTYVNSPHRFVDQWDTPILIIHSEQDYRIVASQGMAAYNAALVKGVSARYLYFPDENHWVLQPQNSILWHRNFYDWLDKWLK